MNFYTKVLSGFVSSGQDVKIKVSFEVESSDGVSDQKVEDASGSLRELGLDDDVKRE